MARLPLNSMIVPASQHTLFMRGFNGDMDKEDIKEFFNKEGGECSFDFYKLSEDRRFLYVALRFESKDVAKDVMARFHDKEVLGSKITISWYKDLRRARQKAMDAMRDRRDRYQNYFKNDSYQNDRRPPPRSYQNKSSSGRHENGNIRGQRSHSYDEEGSEEGEIRNREGGPPEEGGAAATNRGSSRSSSRSGSFTGSSKYSRSGSGSIGRSGSEQRSAGPEDATKVTPGAGPPNQDVKKRYSETFNRSRSSKQPEGGTGEDGAGSPPNSSPTDGPAPQDGRGGGYHHKTQRNYYQRNSDGPPPSSYYGGGRGNRRGGPNGPPGGHYDRYYRGRGSGGGGYYNHHDGYNGGGYKGPRGNYHRNNNYYDDRGGPRHRRSWDEQRVGGAGGGPDGPPGSYDRRRRPHYSPGGGSNRRGGPPSYRSSSRSSSRSSRASSKSSNRSGRRRSGSIIKNGPAQASSTSNLVDMNSTKLGSLFNQQAAQHQAQQSSAPAAQASTALATSAQDEDDVPLAKLAVSSAPTLAPTDSAEKFLANVLGNLGSGAPGPPSANGGLASGAANGLSFLPPIKVAPPVQTKININLKMMSTTTFPSTQNSDVSASGGAHTKPNAPAGPINPSGNLVPLPSSIWTAADDSEPPSLKSPTTTLQGLRAGPTSQFFDPNAAVTYPFASIHGNANNKPVGHSISTSIPSGVPQLSIDEGDGGPPGLGTFGPPGGLKDKAGLRDAYEKFLDDVNFNHNKQSAGTQSQQAPAMVDIKVMPPGLIGSQAQVKPNETLLEEYDEEEEERTTDWRDDQERYNNAAEKKQRKKRDKPSSALKQQTRAQDARQYHNHHQLNIEPGMDLANPFAPVIPLTTTATTNMGGTEKREDEQHANTIIKKRRRHRFEEPEDEKSRGAPLASNAPFPEKRFPTNASAAAAAAALARDRDFTAVDDFPEPAGGDDADATSFRRRRRSQLVERGRREPSPLDDYEDEEENEATTLERQIGARKRKGDYGADANTTLEEGSSRDKGKRRSKRKKNKRDNDNEDQETPAAHTVAQGKDDDDNKESCAQIKSDDMGSADNKFSFKTLEVIDSFKKQIETAYKQDCVILAGVAKILLNPKGMNSALDETLRVTTGEKLKGLEQRCIRELSQIFVGIRSTVMADNFG